MSVPKRVGKTLKHLVPCFYLCYLSIVILYIYIFKDKNYIARFFVEMIYITHGKNLNIETEKSKHCLFTLLCLNIKIYVTIMCS